jgi:hypothetical protein
MESATKSLVSLFVNRASPECWVVRDPDGEFWLVPPVDSPWQNRQRFYPTEEMELEPIPGHYKYLLELPF